MKNFLVLILPFKLWLWAPKDGDGTLPLQMGHSIMDGRSSFRVSFQTKSEIKNIF